MSSVIIEEQRNGRCRVRARKPDGPGFKSLGTFGSRADAEQVRKHARSVFRKKAPEATGKPSLRTFGAEWLDRRELAGHRAIGAERSRWKHVLAAHFADWPMKAITSADIFRWLDELAKKHVVRGGKVTSKRLGAQTRRHCFNLLRKCLSDAKKRGDIERNPAELVDPPRPKRAEFRYLSLEEQRAIEHCEALAEPDRLRILFALYTGIRQGEQWNLELCDVVLEGDPHIMVRWGDRGHRPPKSGRPRQVSLVGGALDVATRWVDLLPEYAPKNPLGLMWPTARGCRRQRSKNYGFRDHLEAAGIRRHLRWHDLRHSCASSLVAGWWGRRWSLQEVGELLGHRDLKTTMRYAHLAESVLADAARSTGGASDPSVIRKYTQRPSIVARFRSAPKPKVARSNRAWRAEIPRVSEPTAVAPTGRQRRPRQPRGSPEADRSRHPVDRIARSITCARGVAGAPPRPPRGAKRHAGGGSSSSMSTDHAGSISWTTNPSASSARSPRRSSASPPG